MTSLLFTSDSKTIIAVAADSFLLFLNLQGTVTKTVNMTRYSSTPILSIALRPDNAWLVVGMGARELHILDLKTYQPLKVLSNPGEPIQMSFDSTGTYLAVGCNDQTIRLWNTTKGALSRTFYEHNSWVTSVLFHPKDKVLLSGTASDKKLRIWRAP